ncbi:MAG: Flp family type IVb pilin [Alphaproteobacteria bacterium]|nr:Flp family type IVb pilin [Alphaproteobacteria bacterium]
MTAIQLRAAAESVRRFARDEAGATVVEYSLIVALIFLAIVGAVKGYVNSTSNMYSTINDAVDTTN